MEVSGVQQLNGADRGQKGHLVQRSLTSSTICCRAYAASTGAGYCYLAKLNHNRNELALLPLWLHFFRSPWLIDRQLALVQGYEGASSVPPLPLITNTESQETPARRVCAP